MIKVAIVIQARMSSSRLPNKVLRPLMGVPVLGWVTRRLRRCTSVQDLIVATSSAVGDDPIEVFCEEEKIQCYRGSQDDVLARFIGAAKSVGADAVVRVTGDCPLVEAEVVDRMVHHFLASDLDYTGCVHVRSFPRGLDAEVVRVEALVKAAEEGHQEKYREHVTPYIYDNPSRFKVDAFLAEGEWLRDDIRLVIDDPSDFDTMEEILSGVVGGELDTVSVLEIMKYLEGTPHLLDRMRSAERKHHQKNTSEGIFHIIRRNDEESAVSG